MHYLLLFSFILFSLTGCQDKEQIKKEQLRLINQAKEDLRIELKQEMSKKESLFQQKLAEKEKELQEMKVQLSLTQKKLNTVEQKLKIQDSLLQKQKNMTKTGILIDGDTLIIDANKTQSYFNTISQQLKEKLSKLANDLEKGMVKEKDAGIEIDESRINIDLNKTKTLLETWTKKMQDIAKDFDSTLTTENTNTH